MGVNVGGAFAEYVIRPAEALTPVPTACPAPGADRPDRRDRHPAPRPQTGGPSSVQQDARRAWSGRARLEGVSAWQGLRVACHRRDTLGGEARVALRLGADGTLPAEAGHPVVAVKALTGGHGPDVVTQYVGSAAVDDQAIAMGCTGGRVVLIGSSLDKFSARAVDISWRELPVLGSRGFVPDDIRDATDLYLDRTREVDHLVERVRPLDEANDEPHDLKPGRVFRSILTPLGIASPADKEVPWIPALAAPSAKPASR